MALPIAFRPPSSARTATTAAPRLPFGPGASSEPPDNPFSASRLSAAGVSAFDDQAQAESDFARTQQRQVSAAQAAQDKAAKAAEAERKKALDLEVTRASLRESIAPNAMTETQRAHAEKLATEKEQEVRRRAVAAGTSAAQGDPAINETEGGIFGLFGSPTAKAKELQARVEAPPAPEALTEQDLEAYRKTAPSDFSELDSLKGTLAKDAEARAVRDKARREVDRAKAIRDGLDPEEADAILSTPKTGDVMTGEQSKLALRAASIERQTADLQQQQAKHDELTQRLQKGVRAGDIGALTAERDQVAAEMATRKAAIDAETQQHEAERRALEVRRQQQVEQSAKPARALPPVESAKQHAKALPDGSYETAVVDNLESLTKAGNKAYWSDPARPTAPTPEARAAKATAANAAIATISDTQQRISKQITEGKTRIEDRLKTGDITPEAAQAELDATVESARKTFEGEQAKIGVHLNDAIRDFADGNIDSATLDSVFHAAGSEKTGIEAFREVQDDLRKQDEHVAALETVILGDQKNNPGLNGEALALSSKIAKDADLYNGWLNSPDTSGDSEAQALGAEKRMTENMAKLAELRQQNRAKLATELTKRGVDVADQSALIARAELEASQKADKLGMGELVASKGGIAGYAAGKLPFAGGIVEASRLLPYASTAMKLQNGETPSTEELDALSEYIRFSSREPTWTAKVGETLAALPGFITELATTSGIASAVEKGGTKALASALQWAAKKEGKDALAAMMAKSSAKNVVGAWGKQSLKNKAALMAAKGINTLAAEAVRLPVASAGRIASKFVDDTASQGIALQPEEDRLVAHLDKDQRHSNNLRALDAVVDSYIENVSERTGNAMGGLVPKGLKDGYRAMAEATKKRLLSAALVKSVMKLNPGVPVGSIAKFLKSANFGSVPEEMAEERIGEAARAAYSYATTGQSGYKLPTWSDLSAEAVSFLVPGGMAAVQTQRQFSKIDRAIQDSDLEGTSHLASLLADPDGTAARLSTITGVTVTPEDIANARNLVGPIEGSDGVRRVDRTHADILTKAEEALQAGDFPKAMQLKQMALAHSRQRSAVGDQELVRAINAGREIGALHQHAKQIEALAPNHPQGPEAGAAEAQAARDFANRASALVKIARGRDNVLTTEEQAALNTGAVPAYVDGVISQSAIDELNDAAPEAASYIRDETSARERMNHFQAQAATVAQPAPEAATVAPPSGGSSPNAGAPATANAGGEAQGAASVVGVAPAPSSTPATAPAAKGGVWKGVGTSGKTAEIPAGEAATMAEAQQKLAAILGEPLRSGGVTAPKAKKTAPATAASSNQPGAVQINSDGSQSVTFDNETAAQQWENANRSQWASVSRLTVNGKTTITFRPRDSSSQTSAPATDPKAEKARAHTANVQKKVKESLARYRSAFAGVEGVKGQTARASFDPTTKKLRVNVQAIARQTADLAGDDKALASEIEQVIRHEWIHAGTVAVRNDQQAAEFWNKLTPELQKNALRAYNAAAEAEGREPAPLSDSQKGYEAYRMFTELALDGKLTETANIPKGLLGDLRAFLESLVDWMRKHIASLPKDQRAMIERDVAEIEAALKAMTPEAPIQTQSQEAPASTVGSYPSEAGATPAPATNPQTAPTNATTEATNPADLPKIFQNANSEYETTIIRDSNGDVDRAATKEHRNKLAEKAGMSRDQWEDAQAAKNVEAKKAFFAGLNKGDTLEWTNGTGQKQTGVVEINLDGSKSVRNTTEGSPAQDHLYGEQSGEFFGSADSLIVRRGAKPTKSQQASPPVAGKPTTTANAGETPELSIVRLKDGKLVHVRTKELAMQDKPRLRIFTPTGEPVKGNAGILERTNIELSPVETQAKAEKPKSTPKSSTQLTLSPADAAPIRAFGEAIPQSELYENLDPEWSDGALETEPHVTVLYGLTKHEAAPVAKAIADHGPVTITLGKLSVFANDEYDVLKVDVEGKDLRALNAKLSKLPNENSFPDYKPHMTIAYLKKGEGAKYVGDTRFEGKELTFDTVTFSPPSELREKLGRPELPLKSKEPEIEQPKVKDAAPSLESAAVKPKPAKKTPKAQVSPEPADTRTPEEKAADEAMRAAAEGLFAADRPLDATGARSTGSRMASETGAAQNNEPSPGGLSEADALFERLSKEYDTEIEPKKVEDFDSDQRPIEVEFAGRKWDISIRDRTFSAEDVEDSDNGYNAHLDEEMTVYEDDSWGDVPDNIADIWEKAPKDWWDVPEVDPNDRETWDASQPHYAIQTNDGESGWMDDGNVTLNLREAVDLYTKEESEDKRLVFFTGRTTRGKDRFGDWGDISQFEILALPSFVQKLLRDFPGMTRDEAVDIARTRNDDNTDTWLVAQAYARHRFTNYDDRLRAARDMDEDTDRERSKARFELRSQIDEVMERWSNPPKNDEAAKVSQGGSQQQESSRAAAVVGTWPADEITPQTPPSVNPESTGAEDRALNAADRPATVEQVSPPADRFPAFVEAAKAIIAANVATPEALAKRIDSAFPNGRGRKLSQAFWNAMTVINVDLPRVNREDWSAIYNPEASSSKGSWRDEAAKTILQRLKDNGAEGVSLIAADTPAEAQAKVAEQVQTVADIPAKEITTPEPIKEKKPADTKAMKEQKRYLLERLDDAIAAAPTEMQMQEVRNDLAVLASLSDKSTSSKNTEGLSKLREKYKLDEAAAKDAIQTAIYATVPSDTKIVIEIPGDGTFTLWNDKDTLQDFAKRAKSFPVSTPKSDEPRLTKINPTGIPALNTAKLSKSDIVKAVGIFTSDDETRAPLQNVAEFGDTIVATTGRILFHGPFDGVGTAEDPVLMHPKGALIGRQSKHEEKFGKFPNWKAVIPKDLPKINDGIDTGRMWQVLKQASAIFKDAKEVRKGGPIRYEDVLPAVQLYLNPDLSIGVVGAIDGTPEGYEHNKQDGARLIGTFDADLLMTGLQGMRALGQEKVSLSRDLADVDGGALVMKSKAGEIIVMAMGTPKTQVAEQEKRDEAAQAAMTPEADAEPATAPRISGIHSLTMNDISDAYKLTDAEIDANAAPVVAALKALATGLTRSDKAGFPMRGGSVYTEAISGGKFTPAQLAAARIYAQRNGASTSIVDSIESAQGDWNAPSEAAEQAVTDTAAQKAEPTTPIYKRGDAVTYFAGTSAGEVLTFDPTSGMFRVKWTSGPMKDAQGRNGFMDMEARDLKRPGAIAPTAAAPALGTIRGYIGKMRMTGLDGIASDDVFADSDGTRWLLKMGGNSNWQLYKQKPDGSADYSTRHPVFRDIESQIAFVRLMNNAADSAQPAEQPKQLSPIESFQKSIRKGDSEIYATITNESGNTHDIQATIQTTPRQLANRIAGVFTKLGTGSDVRDQVSAFVGEWTNWNRINGNEYNTARILEEATKLAAKTTKPEKPTPANPNAALIDEIVSLARKPADAIVEMRLLKGTDGKWYGIGGMPVGVTFTGEKGDPYFVYQSKEGTTYGKRFDTREEAEAAQNAQRDSTDSAFRAEIANMSRERLESQLTFWRKEADKQARLNAPLPSQQKNALSPAPESTPPDAITDFDSARKFVTRIYIGDITAQQIKDGWEQFKGQREAIIASASKLTKEELKRFSPFRSSSDTKADLIRAALNSLESYFNPTDSLSYAMNGDMKAAQRAAMEEKVALWTDELIKQKREAREQKAKDEAAANEKAATNPETKEEWEKFIYRKGRKALSDAEVKEILKLRSQSARNEAVRAKGEALLTPDELARYDAFIGTTRKERAQNEIEAKARVYGVEANTETEIIETTHTQKGHALFVVKLADRVERPVYERLNVAAKKLGGYYSSYKGNGAVPGFQFRSRENAEDFQAAARGETIDRTEALQERQGEKKNAAAERLRDQAEKLEEKADEVLNSDRQTNTARRARMAASAESGAESNKAMARTMRALADAIASGEATHLDGVNTKAHVETLESLARSAKDKAETAEGLDYREREKRKYDPATPEQMAYAAYPYPYLHKSDVLQMVGMGEKTPGAKLLAGRVAKIRFSTNDGEQGYLTDADEIEAFRELAQKLTERGRSLWDTYSWKFESYDRVRRMGLTDLPSLRAALREFTEFRSIKARPDKVKEMERALIGQKLPGFFPTPRSVIDDMVASADIGEGMRVLEPSAGKGDIAEAVRDSGAQVDVIERQSTLREILTEKKFNLIGQDFMDVEPTGDYDAVLMNPPFEDGAEMVHVRRAYDFLKPGGKLVAVMSEGPFGRSDRASADFREWLDTVGTSERLPSGTFASAEAFRQTGVNTRLVTITKPGAEQLNVSERLGVDDPEFAAALDALNENLPDDAVLSDLASRSGFSYGRDYADTELTQLAGNVRAGMRTAYDDRRDRQTHEEWNEQARQLIESDRSRVLRDLVTATSERGVIVNPVQVKAAQIMVPQLMRQALSNRDPQAFRDAAAITWAYDVAGTETARGLAARYQPHLSPEERHREALAKVIFTPGAADREEINAAPSKGEKAKRIAFLEQEIERIRSEAVARERDMLVQVAGMTEQLRAARREDAKNLRAEAKRELDKLRAELKRAQAAKDKMELLNAANEKRLKQIEKAFADMGITFDDLFVSKELTIGLRTSNVVKNSLETFNPKEREAIKMMMEGKSDRQISNKTGISRTKVPELEKRFDEILDAKLESLVRRGFDIGNAEELDIDKLIDKNGNILAAGDRATAAALSPEEIRARVEQLRKIIKPEPTARNSGALKRFATAKGDPFRIDISNPAHVVMLMRAAQRVDSNAMDIVYEYWINALLSGPATHVANIAGNVGNAGLEYLIQRPAEAITNALLFRNAAGASLGEYKSMAKYANRAASLAWNFARVAWKTEVSLFDAQWLDKPLAVGGSSGDKGQLERFAIPGKAGRIIRTPSRFLQFADEWAKHFFGMIEAAAQAHRLAKADGLKPGTPEFDNRVQQLVNVPGSPAWLAAVDKAHRLTFTQDLPAPLARAQDLLHARAKTPWGAVIKTLLRFVFPFVKTPYNIFATGLRKTPLGTARMIGKGFAAWRGPQPFFDSYPQAAIAGDLAEQLLGWGAAMMLMAAGEGDPDDDKKPLLITGSRSMSDNRGEDALLKRTRGGGTTLLINGKPVFNYGRYEPFATIITTLVDVGRDLKKVKGGQKPAKAIENAVRNVIDQARSKTFLQGFDGLMQLIEGRTSTTAPEAIRKFIVTGIIPNLVRQPIRNIDPLARDTRNAPWYYHAIPLGGLAEPLYDLYGRPVEKMGNPVSRALISVPTKPTLKNPADTALRSWSATHPLEGEGDGMSYFPTNPSKSLYRFKDAAGKWQDMTPREIATLRKTGGSEMDIAARAAVTNPRAPTQEDINRIKKARASSFSDAKQRLFQNGTRPVIPQRPAPTLRQLLGIDRR